MPSEPTLLELLDDTAAHVDCFASADGPHDDCNARKRADRLRAAATRLREEMAFQGREAKRDNTYAEATACVLTRINGGPMPDGTPR